MFFFNDTATTEIYPLSLHDALPISEADLFLWVYERRRDLRVVDPEAGFDDADPHAAREGVGRRDRDRKSTRLNSSHANISDAVFRWKKNNLSALPPDAPAAVRVAPP